MIVEAMILNAICETMTCDKCPYPCRARENSSKSNCVLHWSEILQRIDPACDWNAVRFRIASGMEYINTGVSKQAIGIPTDEERKKLKEDGYTLMSSYTAKDLAESYEIWLK